MELTAIRACGRVLPDLNGGALRLPCVVATLIAAVPSVAQAQVRGGACDAPAAAQARIEAGEFRRARELLLACVDSSCGGDVRPTCATNLQSLNAMMPSLVFRAHDGNGNDLTNVVVRINEEVLTSRLDGMALPVDPGSHDFTFERSGFEPVTRRLVVERGTQFTSIDVDISQPLGAVPDAPVSVPAPPTSDQTLLGWTLTGVGLAAAGGFAWLGTTGRERDKLLRDSCHPETALPGSLATKPCSDAAVGSMSVRYNLANVAAGLAAVSAGIGLVLVLTDGDSTEASAGDTRLEAGVGPAGGRVTLTGSF